VGLGIVREKWLDCFFRETTYILLIENPVTISNTYETKIKTEIK
jgi:hypothetical protein